MTKPHLAFVGSLAGIPICKCGSEMKARDGIYQCPNPVCEHHWKKFTAIISGAVFFYEVKE